VKRKEKYTGYLLSLPLLSVTVLVVIIPVIWLLLMSFTNKTIGSPSTFIGLANYFSLFRDDVFWKSVTNTLKFSVGSVIFQLLIGLAVALIINGSGIVKLVTRSLIILPWAIPGAITALVWLWMYYDINGVINYALRTLGLIQKDILWLANPTWALTAIIIVNVWRITPFVSIAIIAALQNIPHSLYESSALEGATTIKQFFFVTLPNLKSVIFTLILLCTIWSVGEFQIIHVITKGGPANATQTLATLAYEVGFRGSRLGQSVAISLAILPVVLTLILIISHFLKKAVT